MSDYNIYIHSLIDNRKPTQPKINGKNQTKGWDTDDETEEKIGIPNFSSLKTEAVNQVPILGKIGVAVAAAAVVVKVGFNVADKIMSYQSTETGRYSFYTQFSNTRKVINNIFNPIQSVENYLRSTQNERLTTMRNNEQMKLLGDSVLNKTTRRV